MRLLGAVLALAAAPLTTSMSVSSTPAQTFTGIGGSGAWWPNDLFNFPESVRQNLSDLLFTDAGLGITSYRWNIGAGGVGVSNPVRAPQTFYVSQGQYDWSRDAQGVYFLRAAAARGVPDLTMFANSAPAPLTQGGTSCGSQFADGTGNAYGAFLADVAQHFIEQENIPLKHISPMNEPDNTFGPVPCGQEGMLVAPNQRAEVITGLFNALASRGLNGQIGIIADESSSLDRARTEYGNWLPNVLNMVEALVHHTYDFPSDSTYSSYTNFVAQNYPNKVTWMSEVCCSLGNADGSGRGWSQGYDPTINNALMWSTMLFQSFLVAQEPHYDFWTLVSNGIGCSPLNNPSCVSSRNSAGWLDGLIYYDSNYASNGNHELYLTKLFWVYKHFGNFVKPGNQRMPLQGGDVTNSVMAVQSSDSYYILASNPGSGGMTISVTFPENVCATEAFKTSSSEDFASIGAATSSGGSWSLLLGGMSFSTYVFAKGAC